ncbi:MAG: hypothetical protein E7077_06465 [Bacteroidales bacterium]|nr:hypothetical protein [Bacteroidales bacterium]
MKRILFFIIMLFSAMSLMADDGVCNDVESWSYGHIYTNESNDKIALEKELMLCDQDSITAIFVFKNTTDDTVTVDCAFPINVYFIYTVNKEINKENYLWASRSESTLRLLLGPKDTFDCDEIKSDDDYLNFNDRVYQLALKHDKELRVMSGEKYSKYIDSLNFRSDEYVPNCNIVQDGKPVDILNVGIESSVDRSVEMNFHFHHNLTFLPNSYSKVVVKYRIESFGCNQFGCSYDISTGGTWKGNIKSFMAFVFDGSLSSELNYFSLENWDNWGTGVKRYGVGYKKDYKPHKKECFEFHFGDDQGESYGYYAPPEYKELQFVKLKDIKASASWNNLKTMMDKDRFTSCAITDWQNATLEFTLPQDAYGPYMYNGTIGKLITKKIFDEFRDSLKNENIRFWGDDINISRFFPKDPTIYAYNNVKTISIEQLDEPNDTLLFDVSISDPRDYPYVFDWERFNDIKHMRYFPAGRYRMSIKDIVKGWQCQDTTLITEFCFLKIPKDIADMLADDAISEIPIFDGFPMVLDPSLIPVPVDSSAFKVDTIAVAQSDTVPSDAITATPKIVIMNREIPLSVLIGALIFTVLIILGCVYWQKKHKI